MRILLLPELVVLTVPRTQTDQESLPKSVVLGEESIAVVWPDRAWDDDEDVDEVDRFDNQRLMRIGDTASDLFPSASSASDDSSSSAGSDSDGETSTSSFPALSRTSSRSSVSAHHRHHNLDELTELNASAQDKEFQNEARLTLERAFAEGHTVDNAAVELKTLRMSTNVPLRSVREAVVGMLVDRIPVVLGDPAAQRSEIATVIGRWGGLIDKIGGVDAVETCEVLQVRAMRFVPSRAGVRC